MSLEHPDPEGHLTDITISAIRDGCATPNLGS
jgi:hypothetical protein